MKIHRIVIENFRNFQQLDLVLHDHAVIVGPNNVGKSNLLHGLRLVLDPSLPDTARQLRPEDFWDGVERPLSTDVRLRIVVELTDFESNDDQLAALAECLVSVEPMVARLTYVCQRSTREGASADDLEFFIFGGDHEERRVGYELRRRLPLDLLPALRDAEADLASWRRSPLRPLLAAAWTAIDRAEKEKLADEIDAATTKLVSVAPIRAIEESLQKSLARLTASPGATDAQLGVAPTDPESLVRIVRLLVDGGRRGVGEAGLGSSNVLYVTLKLLEVERLVRAQERDHTFVAIEEPEAHLHPQLQRQVFRDFLRVRPHLASGANPLEALPTTILLTTHSPHIASIAPLKSIIVLRSTPAEVPSGGTTRATVGASAAALQLPEADEADIERYLEATRAELLFARAVILVEGEADLYLVPHFAALSGTVPDQMGIVVSSIGGTHFESYALLLRALGIPFAVVTDGDPTIARSGVKRARALLERLGEAVADDASDDDVRRVAAENGIFIGMRTLEVDVLAAGGAELLFDALSELAPTDAAKDRATAWKNGSVEVNDTKVLSDIEEIGKGRFAQRTAAILSAAASGTYEPSIVPTYIADACAYVAKQLN
jgi:putative ATP-dependent endonuclease of OLD family